MAWGAFCLSSGGGDAEYKHRETYLEEMDAVSSTARPTLPRKASRFSLSGAYLYAAYLASLPVSRKPDPLAAEDKA